MIDITKTPLDDKPTWDLICEGHTKGVFQLETHLGKHWCKEAQPRDLEELADVISIIRPGTLKAIEEGKSATQRYVDRKNGSEETRSLYGPIDKVVATTYNIIIYQEQAMQIAQVMAGFTESQADTLRKAIGKKKADLMKKVKGEFIEGCLKEGHDQDDADKIFDIIEKSSRYSFNKCISGKETIKKSAKGRHSFNPSIEEMYKIRNDIEYAKQTGHLSLYKKWKRLGNYGKGWSLCADQRIRPNVIKDITFQGKRETITLHLSDGKNITVTGNHKFPTHKGIVLAEDILLGDKLYVCGEYEKTDFKPLTRFSDTTVDNRFHTDTYSDSDQGFPAGKDNPSYTNGGYTSFQSFRDQTPDICFTCQSTENIETDHVNGDRTNNDWDNLQKLCSSCHKKKEYLNGRTKRGEKGYPSLMVEVVDITKNEPEDVYDVAMDGPNHNFVINNGITTCNSHAISYALMAYWSAYLKANKPIDFYLNWLVGAKEKIDPDKEIYELAESAKLDNIKINTPSHNHLEPNFSIQGESIYFGITNVKNVGLNEYVKLKTLTEQHNPSTWVEFLVRVLPNVNKRAVNNLISVGYFSKLGKTRAEMLHEFSCIKDLTKKELEIVDERLDSKKDIRYNLENLNRTKKEGGAVSTTKRLEAFGDIISRLSNPGRNLSDNPMSIAISEENMLGVAISCSKVDACADASYANTTCKELSDGKKGKSIVAAEITRIKEFVTKNKDTMAFVSARDDSLEIENIVVFPEPYEKFGDIIYEGATVLLFGEKAKDRNSFIVNEVHQI